MSARVSIVIASICFLLGGAALVPQCAQAQQQKERMVNHEMGPPLKAALDAAKNKQYDVAMAKLKEAEAKKKTAYEGYKLNETLAFIYGQQRKYKELAETYEKMLETPQFVSADKQQTYSRAIPQSYMAANEYAKAIEYGKKWLQQKPSDTEMMAYLGQAYYQTKDYKNCEQTFHNAISAVEKAGGKPQEPWLKFVRTCANNVGDDNMEAQAYENLVRYYPRPEYWQAHLRRASRNERNDLANFNWMRLMADTGALKDADEYMTFSQLGITDYGVPCEAQRTLEDGFDKKILGTEGMNKARQTNTLTKAKEACQNSKTRVTQLTTEVEGDATGQKYDEAGMIYYSTGQYDQAIASLDKAIKKGGVKDPNNAKLVMGISQYHKGERDAARSTFKSLSKDPVLGKVAAAWILRSYN